jgi:hypothetical protein
MTGHLHELGGWGVRIPDDYPGSGPGGQLLDRLDDELSIELPVGEQAVEAIADSHLLDGDDGGGVQLQHFPDHRVGIKAHLIENLDRLSPHRDSSVGDDQIAGRQVEGVVDREGAEQSASSRQHHRDASVGDSGDRALNGNGQQPLMVDERAVDIEGHQLRGETHASHPAIAG